MKLIRKGKVKEVYEEGQNLLFYFTDQISVFDKVIPSAIPYKGESLARTSAYWFSKASSMGIRNHLLEFRHKNEMVVKKFKIIESKILPNQDNYLVPLEFIVRYYVAGSLRDRIENGKTSFSELGFKNMPKYGEKLPEPLFEMTTKFEETDRLLTEEEARKIGGVSKEDVEEIREIILKMDRRINSEALDRGLIHVDGKKEFAMDEARQPILVDTFGTADEDRFWERSEYEENGNLVEKSKEFVRQYYRSTGYHELLMKARSNREAEPPIPALPNDMISKTSKLYIDMFERITGNKW